MREHRPDRREHRRLHGVDSPATQIAAEWPGLYQPMTGEILLEALAEVGCPLCLLAGRAVGTLVTRMVQGWRLPEMTERQVRLAQGFCGPHAWRLVAEATARQLPAEAVSRVLGRVLEAARGSLRHYDEEDAEARLDPSIFRRTVRHAWTKKVARRLTPVGSCALCLLVKRVQEALGYQLLDLLGQGTIRTAYGPASALCLPHFRWALGTAGDKAVLDHLVATETARLESLTNEAPAALQVVFAHVTGAGSIHASD